MIQPAIASAHFASWRETSADSSEARIAHMPKQLTLDEKTDSVELVEERVWIARPAEGCTACTFALYDGW